MGGTTRLSKLGEALSVIFVLSVVALVAELLFILWRRRFLRRRSTTVDAASNSEALRTSFPTPKELLYFLCWKQHHQSRIEPDGVPGRGTHSDTGRIGPEPEDPTDEVIDILKLQAMRGPSRVLFTIREEDREDAESETSACSGEKPHERTRRLSLEEFLQTTPEEVSVTVSDDYDTTPEEEVTVTVFGECETTPYSTPCGSPSYFTPVASPIRGFA